MFEMNLYMFRPQLYKFIDICGLCMWSQIFDKKSTTPSCGDFLPTTAAAVGLSKYKIREFSRPLQDFGTRLPVGRQGESGVCQGILIGSETPTTPKLFNSPLTQNLFSFKKIQL